MRTSAVFPKKESRKDNRSVAAHSLLRHLMLEGRLLAQGPQVGVQ